MRTKMTIEEKNETKRVVDLVLSQCSACATGAETRDLALNFVHRGAAALVSNSGYGFTIDFLKKLTVILEDESESERIAHMN